MNGDAIANEYPELVKPRLVLLEDRFTPEGTMLAALLTEGAVTFHVATDGAGTATVRLDAETACRVARALLDGAQRLDPECWQLKAAHRMIADAYDAWDESDYGDEW